MREKLAYILIALMGTVLLACLIIAIWRSHERGRLNRRHQTISHAPTTQLPAEVSSLPVTEVDYEADLGELKNSLARLLENLGTQDERLREAEKLREKLEELIALFKNPPSADYVELEMKLQDFLREHPAAAYLLPDYINLIADPKALLRYAKVTARFMDELLEQRFVEALPQLEAAQQAVAMLALLPCEGQATRSYICQSYLSSSSPQVRATAAFLLQEKAHLLPQKEKQHILTQARRILLASETPAELLAETIELMPALGCDEGDWQNILSYLQRPCQLSVKAAVLRSLSVSGLSKRYIRPYVEALINDPETPTHLRQTAEQLLQLYPEKGH